MSNTIWYAGGLEHRVPSHVTAESTIKEGRFIALGKSGRKRVVLGEVCKVLVLPPIGNQPRLAFAQDDAKKITSAAFSVYENPYGSAAAFLYAYHNPKIEFNPKEVV